MSGTPGTSQLFSNMDTSYRIEIRDKWFDIHVEPSLDAAGSDVMLLLDRMEGRKFWKWNQNLIMVQNTGHNLEKAREFAGEDDSCQSHRTFPEEIASDYESKTSPYPFQEAAANRMREAPGLDFALFCDPGTGKSKMALDRLGSLFKQDLIRFVLVVAPKGVHLQWALEQIPIHLGVPSVVESWNSSKGDFELVSDEVGGLGPGETLPFRCVNYDALNFFSGKKNGRRVREWRGKGGKAIEALLFLLKKLKAPFALVMDESHMLKNHRTRRWKALKEVADHEQCVSRLLLTGTPQAKDLADEWSQFRIMNEDIIGVKYLTTFRNEYCVMGGFQGKVYQAPRNLRRYREKTSPYIHRATKDMLEGIPEKVYSRWHFNMTANQKRVYKEMRLELIARIREDETMSAANALVSILRLQQISNGFYHSEAEDRVLPLMKKKNNPRLLALKDILESMEGHDPTIIWCRFQEDVRMIFEMGFWKKRKKIRWPHHGGLTDKHRALMVSSWLEEGGAFISTIASAGVGLNLQGGGCRRAIYYSNSENSIQRWQSEDRIHRIGATGDFVTYTDLVARGSRDAPILANLKKKKGPGQHVVGADP